MSWQHNGLAEWTEGTTAYLSIVFSWQLQNAYSRAIWYRQSGYHVKAGGPAVALNPSILQDVAEIGGSVPALVHHNPDATFTSRGCIRHCPFCAVPKIEGDLVELRDWEPKPIICDNNLLACSRAHFDRVIDRLKPLRGVDFNQGLDARLLTAYQASRLTELRTVCIRLAWDNSAFESDFQRAFALLTGAGIKPDHIRVYVLLGFNDTPEDALYRLTTIRKLGAWPNPMRYQPLDAKRRNEYVGENWTKTELKDYSRYWARCMFFERLGVTFTDYCRRRRSV